MATSPPIGSRWLTGNYGPVHTEVTAFDLPVTGSLPDELDGLLLRNGPNPVVEPDPTRYHWFVGDGMVHGVRLRGGRAEWYRNRWVRSTAVAEALGEAPPPTPFGPEVPTFAANTNVIAHAGRIFAIVEAGSPPVELTGELDTVGPSDFGGTLEHPFSAHPKRDPATGELHVMAYYWGWGDRVRYLVVGTDGRVRHQTDIPTLASPMVHDLAITESRALVMDLPCVFDLDAAMGGSSLPYRWKPEIGARLGVLPLGGDAGDVRWFEIEPCYVFHPLNAFDDGPRMVVDVVRWPSMFDTDLTGPNEGTPALVRWTIDTATGAVSEDVLDERGQELPRHDERRLGRPYRYGYAAAVGEGVAFGGALKHDLVAGTTEVRDEGAGRALGELVFVPRRDDADEDDGWLLTMAYDAATDRSELLVLHAQDFTGEPVARVHLPQRVPFGFHGNWVPAS